MSHRPFVVAGAQKSCSTSLAATLRAHPTIEMPELEVGAFEGTRWAWTHRRIARAAARASARRLVFGFKRPEVFHNADLGLRVAKALPGLSAVVVLRDQAERMLSAYFHYVDHGVLRIKRDFEHHLLAMLAAGDKALTSIERTILRYSDYASSAAALQTSLDGRALFVFQDDLLRQPIDTLTAIQAFVGVDPDPTLVLGTKNAGRYPMRSNLAARLFGLATYRVDPASDGLVPRPQVVRTFGRPFASFRPSVRDPIIKPELSTDLQAMAQERYGPDLTTLEAILGCKVPASWRVQPS